MVANGDGDDSAEPVGLRQRLAGRDVLATGSVPAICRRRWRTAAGALLLASPALVFLLRRGVTAPEVLEGGLLLTLMPLLSPQGWDYVFLIATPAVVLCGQLRGSCCRSRCARSRSARWPRSASIVFDLVGRATYYALMRLSFVSVCFFMVIAALVALGCRVRKIA